MIKTILLIIVVIFFAMNMGGSGIAPSFSASYGGKMIRKKNALILFSFFVIVGAVALGKNVSLTLGKNLLPQELISFDVVLIVLASATISLFLANVLKIPQSTSQVTVGAIIGVGIYFNSLYLRTLFIRIIPMWIILPLLSYVLTFLIYRNIYPPENDNLHIYEKIFANERSLRMSSLIVSCYVAFAIGTNNVANAVGPLYGAGVINIKQGLVIIAPLFGIGAMFLGKGTLATASSEIVPLGLVSGTIVSFVTATLLIVASVLCIPQSLVQLNLASIFAISSVKNGHKYTLNHFITKKMFAVWIITPLISTGLTFLLLSILLRR